MIATRERGSATVWVLLAIAVIVTAGGAVAAGGAALVSSRRAAEAADEAALAAAGQVLSGPQAACASARRLAAANGAELVTCRLDGPVATVTVRADLAGPLRRFGPARSAARAGP